MCASRENTRKATALHGLCAGTKERAAVNRAGGKQRKAEKGKLDSDFVILFEKLDTFTMNVRVDIFYTFVFVNTSVRSPFLRRFFALSHVRTEPRCLFLFLFVFYLMPGKSFFFAIELIEKGPLIVTHKKNAGYHHDILRVQCFSSGTLCVVLLCMDSRVDVCVRECMLVLHIFFFFCARQQRTTEQCV